jgi:glyoxylase-like metal-dependent hydrolase (beta-lactamase superfamily II)
VGSLAVELLHLDIHSRDATVLHLPSRGLLLAGDTLEDTVTYVAEPDGLDRHLADLERLRAMPLECILPNHGDPDVIAAGGYRRTLVTAAQQYTRALRRCREDADLREADLKTFVSGPLQAGWVNYFAPYETVHRRNVKLVTA